MGTYLAEGDEIVLLGNESQIELRLSISQDDINVFQQCEGRPVTINVRHHALWQSPLKEVTPRATTSIPHPALATIHGGPLAVKQIEQFAS